MRVLITGINGFIGKHLANFLIERNYSVAGLDNKKKCFVKGVKDYFYGSVLNKKIVEKAVKNSDVVIHLAALTAHEEIVDRKFETLEINFLGTKNVLDSFLNSKTAKKFLYPSSGKVYGTITSLPITEEYSCLPLNALGRSKLITERLIDFYAAESRGKSFIIFRIFNVFGPGQKTSFLIPTILKQIQESNSIILGDIKAKRDYIYINDVINAFVLSLEREADSNFSIFNLSSNKETSAEEIVSKIAEIIGRKIKIKINKSKIRKNEMSVEYGSSEKIRKLLGWKPKYSIEEGLKETIKFYNLT